MSKTKKPFKETGVGKFLINKAPSILGMVGDAFLPGNVISELISGNKELSEGDKAIALEKLRVERAEIDGVTLGVGSQTHKAKVGLLEMYAL